MRLPARGVASWLGGVGVLGLLLGGGALAESQPCPCSAQSQRVMSEHPCIIINTAGAGCGASRVQNSCTVPVTLVDWPLRDEACPDRMCSRELQPREEAFFDFGELEEREEGGSAQASYVVRVEGVESTLSVTANIVCRTKAPENGGCASAPGALAALGVLLLAVPVARRRRGGCVGGRACQK